MTRQRKVILEEIKAQRTHPTAEDLFKRVQQRLPNIGLGTVYRNLDTLCSHGYVRRLGGSSRQQHFDGDTSSHLHIRCVCCDRIDDVFSVDLANAIDAAARETDFEVTGQEIEFVGVCRECRAAEVGCRGKTNGRCGRG